MVSRHRQPSLAPKRTSTITGKKRRIGFIGSGGIAQTQIKHLKTYADVELVAASDPSEAALGKTKTQQGVQKLYAETTIAALKAGCHGLVEKPLAMTAAGTFGKILFMRGQAIRRRGIYLFAEKGRQVAIK